MVTGGQQRAAADHLREAFGVSQRRAAKALGRSRSTVRYQPTVRGDEAALAGYRTQAPYAEENHPSDEHLLPLHVAYGAAGEGARGRPLHRSFTLGNLSMAAYAFG